MYLKSLTLKGFKSFASATALDFEKGVTCIVGPNGSGKSNVVDAMAWVMGEQAAKALRGSSMQDVIFSGSSTRAPLGRAEVALTIDNSDGALPIEYTEVTISRTLFRNGTSEYAINGDQCRLLDVQELLSDTGMGRQMHVIVGQNQLGQILRSSADERRGFIEEAAGVLKYRRRKEKALRKLEATEANMQRLADLTSEIRRQLKPLGRQAEAARRAAIIQADARDARLRLLADDLVGMTVALAREVADETALRTRRAEVEEALAEAQGREQALEEQQRAMAPQFAALSQTWFDLAGLKERTTGLAALASERIRLLEEEADDGEPVVRDPDELDAQAREHRGQEQELSRHVEQERATLNEAVRVRSAAESELSAHDVAAESAARASADRRELLARLAGMVSAAQSRVDARVVEIERLAAQHQAALERAAQAQTAFRALESSIAGLDAGEVDLDAAHSHALAAQAEADAQLAHAKDVWQKLDRQRAAAQAKVEALGAALAQDNAVGTQALRDLLAGALGPLAQLVTLQPGSEHAVAAALGPLADAVAVSDRATAFSALHEVRHTGEGRAALLVLGADAVRQESAPAGSTWLIDCVSGPAEVVAALSHLLQGFTLVRDFDHAQQVLESHGSVIAVTPDGDIVSAAWASAGDATATGLQLKASYDAAEAELSSLSEAAERAQFAISAADASRGEATVRVEQTLSRLHESDAKMSAVAEQLGEHAGAIRNAQAEAQRLSQAMADATSARDADVDSVTALQQQFDDAQSQPEVEQPSDRERQNLADAVEASRSREMDLRLNVRTTEERMQSAAAQAEAAERAARESRAAIDRAIRRKEQRERQLQVARAVLSGAGVLALSVRAALVAAERDRDAAESKRLEHEAHIASLRSQLRELASEHEQLTDTVHRDDLARAEQRMRIEALQEKVLDDFGVDADTLVAEYGPDALVPPSQHTPADEESIEDAPQPYAYVRSEQERRLAEAEKGLALLGRVNPLALEEFSAMEERHKFLSEQLDDLKRGRADLMAIITEVDERMREAFASAFEETAAHFAEIFPRLFPGGDGRMYLTDETDLLTTGVEIEARPPGKKPRSLLQLSGGESSLTAVAFLVAIFKARPSPFYVLDEVEAALDDVNLGRLLDVLADLKGSSQLIIITHQKRTMEIADALYGVSMRGDGLSAVIGQRISDVHDSDREPAVV